MILASKSPRRQELLKIITRDFKVLTVDTDEIFNNVLSVYENLMKVSYEKCNAVRLHYKIENDIIIGGDTICYLDNKVLGKPKNYDDAYNMIKSYDNKTQEVITGVTIMKVCSGYIKTISFYEISYVTFNNITDIEIVSWLKENEYLDKAGAYAIQNNKNKDYFNIEYSGSYNNIVGFPTEKIIEYLKEL